MKNVYEVLAKVLNIDVTNITDESGPNNIASWDSFNALILVTELEKNFKVKFTIDEVVSVKNVGDIKKILKKYGIQISKTPS